MAQTCKHPAIDLFELVEEGGKGKERFVMQKDGNKRKEQDDIKKRKNRKRCKCRNKC